MQLSTTHSPADRRFITSVSENINVRIYQILC